MITFQASAKFNTQAAVILIDSDQLKSKKFNFSNAKLKNIIDGLVKSNQFEASARQLFPVVDGKSVYLLVGLGKNKELSLTELRVCVRKALTSAFLQKLSKIELIAHETKDAVVCAIIEGALLGTYAWRKYLTQNKTTVSEKKVILVAPKKKIFENAITICAGTNLARDLVNENADVANSAYLEKTIKDIVRGNKNCKVEILGRKEMKAKGLGLHLAVNQASANEPKLIIVKYTGASKSEGYMAFIGKGMTYDTGGLNLKPTGSIETMKIDMGGAAAVIGTLKNTLALKLRRNIVFAVGLAENVTGSKSYKPGAVIKGYAGKTVEVANTDAEGRLVLADAIAYVVKNYKPKRIIDIATLTGACVVALGNDYTGLVTTDDKFSRALVHASNETDDRVWRLPMYPELRTSVKSQIADIRNLGFPRGAAGTITAAEFLRQFTDSTSWAHLDIAGTAYVENQERMYFGHGATGSGVRLVTHYLIHQ